VLPVSVLLKVAMKVIVYTIFCMSGLNQEDLRYYKAWLPRGGSDRFWDRVERFHPVNLTILTMVTCSSMHNVLML